MKTLLSNKTRVMLKRLSRETGQPFSKLVAKAEREMRKAQKKAERTVVRVVRYHH